MVVYYQNIGNLSNNKFQGPTFNSKKSDVAYFEISATEDTYDINGNAIPQNTWMVYDYQVNDAAYNTLYRICVDGIYTRKIRAVYNDGTYSEEKVYTIKVDKTSPSVPTSNVSADGSIYSSVSSYNMGTTSSNIVWNNFNSQDNLSGISRYEYSVNCKNTSSGSVNINGYTYKTNMNKKYCIRAVDYAGNYSNWSDPYYFKINKSVASSMTLNSTKVVLNMLKNKTYKIEVKYPEGVNSNAKAVTYKTSNSNVATVSNSGVITPRGKGTATITVTNKSNKSLYKTMTVQVVKKAGVLIGDSKTVQLGGSTVKSMNGTSYNLNYSGYTKKLFKYTENQKSTVSKNQNLYFIARGGQGYTWLSTGVTSTDVEEGGEVAGKNVKGGFVWLKLLLTSAFKTYSNDTDFYIGVAIGGNDLKNIGLVTSSDIGDKCQTYLDENSINSCKNEIDALAKKYVDLYEKTLNEINTLKTQKKYKGDVYFKILSDLPVAKYTRTNGTEKTCESGYYYGKKTNDKVSYFNSRVAYYIGKLNNSKIQYVDTYNIVKNSSKYQLIDGVHFSKDTAQYVLEIEMNALGLLDT